MNKKSIGRLDVVDGLRGVAVLMVVMLSHFIGTHFDVVRLDEDGPDSFMGHLLDLNITGVHLFFIISGFLLGGILLDHRGAEGFFSSFYIRRLTRILPLYFGSLLAFAILVPHLDSRFDWLTGEQLPLWSYVLFFQNNVMAATDTFGGSWLAPTWSLAVEEQFYILLPFLIFYTPARLLPRLLLACILLAPILRAAAGLAVSGTASIVLLTSCMDALCYGILAAYLVRSARGRRLIQRHLGLLGHLAWSLPLLGVVLSYYGDALDVGARVVGSFWLITTGYTALLLFATQAKGTWLHRLLTMSALRWIGIRCYALYLVHQAVMGLMGGYFAGRSDFLVEDAWTFTVWLGAIAATLALAALSWRFVERPMIAFGHRWTYQRRRATASAPQTQPVATEAPTRHAA